MTLRKDFSVGRSAVKAKNRCRNNTRILCKSKSFSEFFSEKFKKVLDLKST
jgi:hypothetical protein